MTNIKQLATEFKEILKTNAPVQTQDQKKRMYNILNSENPDFLGYGIKAAELDKIVKNFHSSYDIKYDQAVSIFKILISSNVHDEKFAAFTLLNRFKKHFTSETVDLIYQNYAKYCDTWALCDSTMIKLLGPFLAKKNNEELAKQTIEKWSKDQNLWIRRASMVILLKIIMINKEYDSDRVFELIERMLQYDDDYIQKAIGWLLKTCSRYDEKWIINYLNENKKRLSRLILRYASEKISKVERAKILQS